MIQPKKRSFLRLFLGKRYFSLRRLLSWYFAGKNFAQNFDDNLLPNQLFSHKTPLYRKLDNLDQHLQRNKKQNIQLAIKRLSKIVVHPGETFSYWRLIGKPTKGKGYLPGLQLFCGTLQEGIGGGLCQLSNLIYWITLHTPLSVTERYRHSYDVFPDSKRTQPFGSGATCVYPYRDLQILNETNLDFQLLLKIEDDSLWGSWSANLPFNSRYRVYEKEHRMTQEFWGGYVRHNLIYRQEFDAAGTEIEDREITQNHALMMYEPFLEERK